MEKPTVPNSEVAHAAVKIATAYAVFASLWILLSDKVVGYLFSDPARIVVVSTLKGWLFVAVTSLLLYYLARRLMVRIHDADRQEREARAEKIRLHGLLTGIVEGSGDVIFAKDLRGRYLLFNREAGRVVGKAPESIVGLDDSALFPRPQTERVRANDARVIAENTLTTFEEILPTVDGERVFLTTKGPLRDDAGQVTGVFGIARDITQRKRAEEALRKSEANLRTLIEDNTSVMMLIDPESGEIVDANAAAAEFYGLTKDALRKMHIQEINALPAEEVAKERQKAARGERKVFNVPHRLATGEIRDVEVHTTPINRDGRTLLLSIIHDITERKRAEEALKRYQDDLEATVRQRTEELLLARDAAEAANKAKSVFLANMSHELRTPLNAILGFSSLISSDPALPEALREDVNIINRSGEHLLKLINDVLEIAKIEAGKLQLVIAPFDLGGMIRDVIEMMQVRARKKGLQLRLDTDSPFPRHIRGDEARLRQVMVNLIGNAIKFTEQGSVTVRLRSHQKDLPCLWIEVEDTGPGIRPEDQKRLFKPFVQLAEAGEQAGTGLGLTIARRFVDLMGGEITVESEPGNGALFRVELPLEQAEAEDLMKSKAQAQSCYGRIIGIAPGRAGYRILIVEDHPESQRLLHHLIANVGFDVALAENGERAVRSFQDWHPDLILMDCQMPVMDGEEATRRIRKLPGGDKVKIVAVTASVFKEQQQEMLDAGMDDIIRKPYRFEEIYECLARQLGVRYVYADTSESKAAVLTPAMFSSLPESLRVDLREGLESQETARITHVISQVARYDEELQKTLAMLAEDFDYTSILNALPTSEPRPEDRPSG